MQSSTSQLLLTVQSDSSHIRCSVNYKVYYSTFCVSNGHTNGNTNEYKVDWIVVVTACLRIDHSVPLLLSLDPGLTCITVLRPGNSSYCRHYCVLDMLDMLDTPILLIILHISVYQLSLSLQLVSHLTH